MDITIIAVILLAILCLAAISLLWLLSSRHNERLQEALQALSKTQEHERQLKKDIESLKTKVHHATEDAVTRLPSWQLFEDRLRQSVKESARYQLVLGLLVIELEGFPLAGDPVVHEVAQRLKRCIRLVDSVSRLNKEVFIVMITRLAKPETAAIVTQRILHALAQPIDINGESLRISANIGIATFPHDGQDGAELLLAAQHALQVAKMKGAQRYEFFQPAMFDNSRRILLISSGLNSEEIEEQFVLRYQPIIHTHHQETICMDALVSWEHSELGSISTEEWLEHAEKQQKLNRIAEWLLRTTCQQFVHWRSAGLKAKLLSVTLPISLLQSSTFVCKLPQILKQADFDPACLLIQLKPGSKPLSFDVLEKSFNMLRYLGAQLALDDFGANGLSIVQLKQFPVSYFKLDKTLIKDIQHNPQTTVVIQSSLELAKNLGAELIVQGVDTVEQLERLKAIGCILMQGKAIVAPLTETEITNGKYV